MARAIWTGALSFGLVNVPVGLYTATEDKTIHFNQLERGTSDRVRNKRVNERTGEEVAYDSIVKGYDLGGGRYVVVENEDLESVEPERSRYIEISDFVGLDEIDPVYFKSTYYLAPQGIGADRAYALLRQAMAETRRVGIATFVMRGKQHLALVRPGDGVLVLETMYFPDEIRDPQSELGSLPSPDLEFGSRELDTAKLLVDSMTTVFDPEGYRDTYRAALEDLIERKSRGEVIASAGPVPEPTPVVDLMDALRASVEAARLKRAAGGEGPAGAPTAAGRKASPRQVGPPETAATAPAASSKSALLAQAAELGIQGRTKMSREELEAAVTAAASAGGPAASSPARRRKAS